MQCRVKMSTESEILDGVLTDEHGLSGYGVTVLMLDDVPIDVGSLNIGGKVRLMESDFGPFAGKRVMVPVPADDALGFVVQLELQPEPNQDPAEVREWAESFGWPLVAA